jgi:hypothetical protein
LCARFRRRGWCIERIAWPMTEHDVAMTSLSQWWARRVRGGWAFAEGAAMYGGPGERYNLRATLSTWFWAVGLPLVSLAGLWPTGGLSLLLLTGYPLLFARITWTTWRSGFSPRDAMAYAGACILGKWPEAQGQWRYWRHRLRRRPPRLIEYKRAEANS